MFYTIAIAFAGGIFLRSVFAIPDAFTYALLVIDGALLLLLYGGGGTRAPQGARVLLVSLACFCVALGMLRFDISTRNERDALFDRHLDTKVVVEGVIVREVDERANTAQVTVRAESLDGAPADRRILIITDRFPEFQYGDRVRAEGRLGKPEAFETDLGRTFDYPGYLSVRGVSYTLPFAKVEKVGEGEGSRVLAMLFSIKHAFMKKMETVFPEPHAGLALGLVLGVKRALGKELEEAFRITGIIHIVVLSGYNITIVVEAVMRLLAFVRLRVRTVLGVCAIAAFALIAGLSATVLRASLMAVLVLIARATGRTYDIARALVFSGLVMLLFNPKLLVFDPGFQLSFLATLGLILVAPRIEAKLSLVPTRLQIREFMTSTIATQILVLPLLLYSMGMFSVVALLVNILVLPVVPLTMLLVFLSGVIGFLSYTLALPVAFGAYLLLSYIIGVVEHFAALPFAAFSVPAFPFWIVVVVYAIIALLLWRFHRNASLLLTS